MNGHFEEHAVQRSIRFGPGTHQPGGCYNRPAEKRPSITDAVKTRIRADVYDGAKRWGCL